MCILYFFALATIADRLYVVETLGITVTIVDDITSDDGWFAVKTVTAESWSTNADVATARFVHRTGGIDVTVVHLIASGLLFLFLYCVTTIFKVIRIIC